MPKDKNTTHKELYDLERVKRWNMAESEEQTAIEKIIYIISDICDIPKEKIKYDRLDKKCFEKYPIENNEWVKGSPDYIVILFLDEQKYLFIEIKLKSKEYKKTLNGGKTKEGSIITKYGCLSYYLDVEPVYGNMIRFCNKTGLGKDKFLIAFVSEDLSDIKIASLAKIENIVNKGWKKNNKEVIQVCVYGEGYGQDAYLIPKDAISDIRTITQKQWLMVMSAKSLCFE
jgi:hypothetical protein